MQANHKETTRARSRGDGVRRGALRAWRVAAYLFMAGLFVAPGWAQQTAQWQPLTVEWSGPAGLEELGGAVNPFLDYRLSVTFSNSVTGASYTVPGFYAGNDASGDSVWRAHFTPDAAGVWQYEVDFRSAPGVAVLLDDELDDALHPEVAFDGQRGVRRIAPRDASAPGFLSAGRLAYTGGHYLETLGDGKAFIKTGLNSPENLLGYAGFDNTYTGGELLDFAAHAQDWNPGDPTFTTTNPEGNIPGARDGKGLIGAMNYLGEQGVNAVYVMVNNIGGDGRDTHPYADPDVVNNGSAGNDNLHFDVSKLDQWNTVFEHAQRNGVLVQLMLNEAEGGNVMELDDGELGVERKLYYRELVARFGHLNGLNWNISEEYNRNRGTIGEMSPDKVKEFAAYLSALDAYDHPLTVHNGNYADWPIGTAYPEQHFNFSEVGQRNEWEPFFGHEDFDLLSYQIYNEDGLSDEVEALRARSVQRGRPIPIMIDEPATFETLGLGPEEHNNSTEDVVRRRLTYDVLFSGGGIGWFVRPEDTSLDDFRPYEQIYREARLAREFMEVWLPVTEMTPNDDLLRGADDDYGGAEVLANAGEVYAFYLPNGSNDDNNLHAQGYPELDLRDALDTSFRLHWFNPRSGELVDAGLTLAGGDWASIGATPDGAGNPNDWVGVAVALRVIPEPAGAVPTAAVLLARSRRVRDQIVS